MEIRAYDSHDFDAVTELYKDRSTYGGHYDEERDTAERLQATSEQGDLLVAESEGCVVGSCMILDNPHSFWLLRFVIENDNAQADEIASALLEQASRIATERGHKSIMVYTDENSENLKDRYRKLGCHEADVYRCYWKEVTV